MDNPASSETRVAHDRLFALTKAILMSAGVPEDDAEITSDCLVTSNLRGVDTHGVIRLRLYVDRVRAGGNKAHPNIQVAREGAVTALLDGDDCLGPVGGRRAMDLAIEKARETGLGAVAIRRSNHYGPAAHYATMALPHDMIGLSMTNTLASMPPTGGREARLGNNPFALAFPTAEEPPVVLDYATSLASWGRVFQCAQKGEPLPEDCYLDAEGRPTIRPEDITEGGGVLLPIAGYKGYGMALAIATLTGLLSDATFDGDIPHPYNFLEKPGENAFFMAALRVDQFVEPEHFKKRLDEIVRQIRSTPLSPGVERVYLPGEKEHETEQQRRNEGIPLNENMLAELRELADEANVPFELG